MLLSGCRDPSQLEHVACPPGYVSHNGKWLSGQGGRTFENVLARCGSQCDQQVDCLSFEINPSDHRCIQSSQSRPLHRSSDGYGFCKKKRPSWGAVVLELSEVVEQEGAHIKAGLLELSEVVEQKGAHIKVGGEVRLYAVGASNVLWMTWIDQLHLYLSRLGYTVPVVPAKTMAQVYPTSVPTCDDSKYFTHLKTARLGRIGWNSWDFAYDDWSDCDAEGFRNISDVRVKCEHGEGCSAGRLPFIKVADIAEDAGKSNVTLVSTWLNDNKQFQTEFRCFNGKKLLRENTSVVVIPTLLRLVRAIHAKNPNVWILIMSKYPPTYGGKVMPETVPWVKELNSRVKEILEQEPRTFFVDYEMPANGVEMYQTGKAHYGHPNCRGSKLMAHAVLQRLWIGKVLARTIKLEEPKTNTANPNCDKLKGPACHTSVLCWVDQEDGSCKEYSSGSSNFHQHFGLPDWVPGQHKHD